ncbi:MAG: ATP-binding protein [Bacteroidia bacterium]
MKSTLVCLLQLFWIFEVFSQNPAVEKSPLWKNTGTHLMQFWATTEYRGDAQCFSIVQDPSGIIYAGTPPGIVEYDGSTWKTISMPNLVAFSMDVSDAGVVYAGGPSDFGFLWPDSVGNNQYHSLLNQLPKEKQDIAQVWGTFAIGEDVFFQSFTRLIRWRPEPNVKPDKGKITVWEFPFAFSFAASVRDELYFFTRERGVTKLVGDSLKTIPGGSVEAISDKLETIWSMLPYPDPEGKKILVATQENGLFLYDGNSFTPFESPANRFIVESQVYLRGVLLEEGVFAYNSLGGGIMIIDSHGNILEKVDDQSGLISNSVLSLYVDKEKNLWASPLGQIIRMEIPGQMTVFADNMADAEMIYHQGSMYFGNLTGIRYKTLSDTQNSSLINISGPITQISRFHEIDEKLFVSTRDGIFEIRNKTWIPLFPPELQSVMVLNSDIVVSRFVPNQWYINIRFNIGIYNPQTGKPPLKITQIDEIVENIEEEGLGLLWVKTQSGNVFRVEFDPYAKAAALAKTTPYGESEGLKTMNTYMLSLHDKMLFSTEKGLREFDANTKRFVPSFALGKKFADTTLNIDLLQKLPGEKLAIGYSSAEGENMLEILQPKTEGGYSSIFLPTHKISGGETIKEIIEESPGVFWILTITKTVRYVYPVNETKTAVPPFKALVRKVTFNQDSLIFAGNIVPGFDSYPALHLPYSKNNIRFEYSATTYQTPENVWFQYRLIGNNETWSSWTEEKVKEYTNLWEGAYQFEVRAKNIYDQISEPVIYSFSVFPPWYRTLWAYLGYFILAGGMVFLLLRFQKKRQQKLHEKELNRERAINERLIQIDHMKDQFLANTSHELRTPLNGIIGITESLFDASDDPHVRKNLGMVVSSGKRLASLVDDLLDFSRIRNADLELRQRPTDLHTLVEVVLQVSQPMTQGKKITLYNEIPADLPAVYADEDRITQVLYNLVGNAIKFTEQGFVKVGAKLENEQMEISVTDSGIGIPEDKREAIFEAFVQADGSISRTYAGTGLGLSISRNLIERHNGRIWVESTIGEGSTFFFTLPVSKEIPETFAVTRSLTPLVDSSLSIPRHPAAELIPAKTSEIVATNGLIRILIVDDEPINHQVLKNHLPENLYQVFSAMNGNETMSILENEKKPFDLVLLDVMMPRMSGYEVCQRIREKYLPSQLPVIMVTAKNQINDLVQGLNTGANDYLAKPFSKDEFLARLGTHLNLHRINLATNRFVPSEFIQTLGRKAITDVQLGDNIYREVTVFFSDIRGYTTIAEQMTPVENFQFVQAYAQRMGPVIQRNNGFVNQYLGDGIMALFQGSSKDALNASIEMQAEIDRFNQELKKNGSLILQVGMGFHTGPLVMGIIGDMDRSNPAIISDTVNTAARLEGLTKYYHAKIIFSEISYQSLSPEQKELCRHLGLVQVKGKKEPMGIYECLSGELPDIRDQKLATRNDFHQGIQAYIKGDFMHAVEAFKSVLTRHPEDETAIHFLRRCEELNTKGVRKNWAGVEEMSEK